MSLIFIVLALKIKSNETSITNCFIQLELKNMDVTCDR